VGLVRVIERVTDPVGFLQQVARILTRDGCVVVAVPNIMHGGVRLRLLAGQAPPIPFEAGAPPGWCGFDASSLKELLSRAGFIVTRTELCQEGFDSEAALFSEPDMRRIVLDRLATDTEALTSAYVVVGHKSPLSKQVQLELRIRELSTGYDEGRHGLKRVQQAGEDQDKRLSDLYKRQADLSKEFSDLKQILGNLGPESPRLKEAHHAVTVRIGEADAVWRELGRLQYAQVIARIQEAVRACLPHNAVVLVVSKGDPKLLELGGGRTGWHFLQSRDGVYAGHHPADSGAAIKALEQMMASGASYLLLPRTAFWWLDHYAAFKDYLNRFRLVFRDDRTCLIHALDRTVSR
jgi:hypothetical protein